jgi:hypothetical protein
MHTKPWLLGLVTSIVVFGCVEEAETTSQDQPDGGEGREDSGDQDGAVADGGADSALGQRCGTGGLDPGPLCPAGFYCYTGPGLCLGSTSPAGFCVPVPEECPEETDEVCGCDDVTYDNACAMHMARVDSQFHDACDRTCTSNADCASNELCSNDLGGWTGSCDLSEGGRCMNFTLICEVSLGTGPLPVCGCDGQTYGSPCEAFMEGRTNVAAFDPCETEDGGM